MTKQSPDIAMTIQEWIKANPDSSALSANEEKQLGKACTRTCKVRHLTVGYRAEGKYDVGVYPVDIIAKNYLDLYSKIDPLEGFEDALIDSRSRYHKVPHDTVRVKCYMPKPKNGRNSVLRVSFSLTSTTAEKYGLMAGDAVVLKGSRKEKMHALVKCEGGTHSISGTNTLTFYVNKDSLLLGAGLKDGYCGILSVDKGRSSDGMVFFK